MLDQGDTVGARVDEPGTRRHARLTPAGRTGGLARIPTILASLLRRNGYGISAVLWATVLTGVQGARLGKWIVDDAGISFAYARSFATGHGPVVQPGAAPVEGYSNPTWVALLAMGRLLGLFDRGTWFGVPDYIMFPKALALVFVAGIMVALYMGADVFFASRRSVALVTAVAGTALALTPSFVIWCFSGLENSLYALLVTVLAVLMARAVAADRLLALRLAVVTGVLVALAALTRPDGLIYLFAYPAVTLLVAQRTAAKDALRAVVVHGGTFAALFGSYLLWRRLEFHRWVSNTAVAKAQEKPNTATLNHVTDLLSYPGLALALLILVALVMAMMYLRDLRRPMLAVVVPLMLAMIAYSVINADWMGQFRFATPVWSLTALAGTVAVGRILLLPGLRRRIIAGVALAASLYAAQVSFTPMISDAAAKPVVPLCAVTERNGEVFNAYADIAGLGDNATLLLPDLGGSSLTSRLRLRDIAGLVDAPVADFYKTSDMPGLRNYIFDKMKPTFIQVHDNWTDAVSVDGNFDPRLQRDYFEIYTSNAIYGIGANSNSDWIRKSALKSPAIAKKLHDYAAVELPRLQDYEIKHRLGSCPSKLTIGQMPNH